MNRAALLHSLKAFKEMNEKKYRIKAIGIFGSYARNKASEFSDVDIVVRTETPDLFNIVHIKEDLEEQLHMPVAYYKTSRENESFSKRADRKRGSLCMTKICSWKYCNRL